MLVKQLSIQSTTTAVSQPTPPTPDEEEDIGDISAIQQAASPTAPVHSRQPVRHADDHEGLDVDVAPPAISGSFTASRVLKGLYPAVPSRRKKLITPLQLPTTSTTHPTATTRDPSFLSDMLAKYHTTVPPVHHHHNTSSSRNLDITTKHTTTAAAAHGSGNTLNNHSMDEILDWGDDRPPTAPHHHQRDHSDDGDGTYQHNGLSYLPPTHWRTLSAATPITNALVSLQRLLQQVSSATTPSPSQYNMPPPSYTHPSWLSIQDHLMDSVATKMKRMSSSLMIEYSQSNAKTRRSLADSTRDGKGMLRLPPITTTTTNTSTSLQLVTTGGTTRHHSANAHNHSGGVASMGQGFEISSRSSVFDDDEDAVRIAGMNRIRSTARVLYDSLDEYVDYLSSLTSLVRDLQRYLELQTPTTTTTTIPTAPSTANEDPSVDLHHNNVYHQPQPMTTPTAVDASLEWLLPQDDHQFGGNTVVRHVMSGILFGSELDGGGVPPPQKLETPETNVQSATKWNGRHEWVGRLKRRQQYTEGLRKRKYISKEHSFLQGVDQSVAGDADDTTTCQIRVTAGAFTAEVEMPLSLLLKKDFSTPDKNNNNSDTTKTEGDNTVAASAPPSYTVHGEVLMASPCGAPEVFRLKTHTHTPYPIGVCIGTTYDLYLSTTSDSDAPSSSAELTRACLLPERGAHIIAQVLSAVCAEERLRHAADCGGGDTTTDSYISFPFRENYIGPSHVCIAIHTTPSSSSQQHATTNGLHSIASTVKGMVMAGTSANNSIGRLAVIMRHVAEVNHEGCHGDDVTSNSVSQPRQFATKPLGGIRAWPQKRVESPAAADRQHSSGSAFRYDTNTPTGAFLPRNGSRLSRLTRGAATIRARNTPSPTQLGSRSTTPASSAIPPAPLPTPGNDGESTATPATRMDELAPLDNNTQLI